MVLTISEFTEELRDFEDLDFCEALSVLSFANFDV